MITPWELVHVSESYDAASDRLHELFPYSADTFIPDRFRLNGLDWTARDAPAAGLAIAKDAADRLKDGQHMDDDPVVDAQKTFALTEDCFHRSRFALESSIRYLHAAGDLLAQFVNCALALGINGSDCKLSLVCGAVDKQSDCDNVASALKALETSDEFRYVADLANRTKHRRVAAGGIGAKLEDDGGIVVRQYVDAFEHDARQHPRTAPPELAQMAGALQDLIASVLDAVADVVTTRQRHD